jgi:CelD/BcsL family acetyltransferase involved in cellulose biosynthesis
MLEVQTVHPGVLDRQDVETWRAMAAARPEFRSPLLGPDFAQAVGALRPDARVAVFRREGRVLGYLPYHRRACGQAWPIGAPLSDYHALVGLADAGFDGRDALAAAGLSAFRFGGLVDPFGVFGPGADQVSHVIAPDDGPEAYLEQVRAANPKKIKNYRRLGAKLERECGPVCLVADDRSRSAFDQLIDWKREQLRRTGTHDFLGAAWSRDLVTQLFDGHQGELRGLMICLYAGQTLVAGHFGVRQGEVFHPWIASTHPDYGPWSPGHQFFPRAIAAMPALGLTTYDLGCGHDHYKRAYALRTRIVTSGLATAGSLAGGVARSIDAAWLLAGAGGPGPVGRLRRRMDAIARVDLTLAGRLRGLAFAVASQGRRRHTPDHEPS